MSERQSERDEKADKAALERIANEVFMAEGDGPFFDSTIDALARAILDAGFTRKVANE